MPHDTAKYLRLGTTDGENSYSPIDSTHNNTGQQLSNRPGLSHAVDFRSGDNGSNASGRAFGDDDDARFYDEFSMYDPHEPKVKMWKRKRFTLLHIIMVAVGCLGLYVLVAISWNLLNRGSVKFPDLLDKASSKSKGRNNNTIGINKEPINRSGKKLLTYQNVDTLNRFIEHKSLDWVAHPTDESVDGLYRELTNGKFSIRKVGNESWEHTLATAADIVQAGKDLIDIFAIEDWSVSADWNYILINMHSERVWRHSVRGSYFVYNTKRRTMLPLTDVDNNRIQRIEWSPVGHRLLFVRDNNIFVTNMAHEIQITEDGNDSVFNGIADWVYEEEVLESGSTSWWSPDGKAIAYLRIDDTNIPEYHYQIYHPTNRSMVYPDNISIHYPKPGAPSPLASLHVIFLDFSLGDGTSGKRVKATENRNTNRRPRAVKFDKPFQSNDTIITGVTWVTRNHSAFLVSAMNRVQDHSRVYLASVDSGDITARLVRDWDTTAAGGDGAWIEITSPQIFVPANTVNGLSDDGYIDLVENGEYTHLALFSPLDSSRPLRWLTSGDWDVVSDSVSLDHNTGYVFYISTQVSSIEFNLYKVPLGPETGNASPTALTPPTITSKSQRLNQKEARTGSYDVSFSTGAGFYLLIYKGPNMPWQAVYNTIDNEFEVVLADNEVAQHELDSYDIPKVEYFHIENTAGDSMNAMALYPPDFDKSAESKYGVLFRVYGGPNSQQVSQSFSLDWHSALVSQQDVPEMPWIVVVVDGRGTGYKGRRFRSTVSMKLGVYEPDDQAAAARYMQKQPYIDSDRIAIWGWSYGGYTAARSVERHPDIFRVGMSVAPVTDWRFYDSVYTERYMKTLEMNEDGYKNSAISNVTAFNQVKFLVQHGTADDNVHIQNTLALVDLLESNNVPGFEMALYTDSDHSIYTHNVRQSLYMRLTNFLFRSFHELNNEQFDYWNHEDPNNLGDSKSL